MNEKHILNPLDKDKAKLEEIFEKLYEGNNAILFLGAGASITNKQYLSKQLIEYCKSKFNIHEDTNDIVEFVDILSSNPNFRRDDFDSYVYSILNKLKPSEVHKTILSINWREILTTNFDLLLERTEQNLSESEKAFELLPIRSVKEYDITADSNIVKYIKLNGCLSDRSKYKLVFSSDDFEKANKFYKKALTAYKNFSPNILFLSIGYSFSDPLAKVILSKFDKYNYRDRKWIYTIDPFIDDFRLHKLTEDRIAVIKMTADDFFSSYRKWESEKYSNKVKNRGLRLTNSNQEQIAINPKISYNLINNVKQLNRYYESFFVSEKDFYLGEEPNYTVITRNFDVVRNSKIFEITDKIHAVLNKTNPTNLIPLIFLTGSFGTGKTTFVYRLLHELCNSNIKDTIAFELFDIESMRRSYILDLIKQIENKNIIFYCNNTEVDSIYKNFIDLRVFISQEQIENKSICFISSIRENFLEIHKKQIATTNLFEFNIDVSLNDYEIDNLLEKLKVNGLIEFRDIHEKNRFKIKIKKEYNSDTFISLLDLVTDGKHVKDLLSAYRDLPSEESKTAFVYTALLHRYNLLMPASLLKMMISKDWNDFTNKVIKVEGKGILIQVSNNSKGTDPDLYFRTKHRLIADKLINEILRGHEDKKRAYEKIFQYMNSSSKFSRLAINLLKSLRENREFDDFQINVFFDKAYLNFQDEPHFLLHFAINLQYRKSSQDLERAIKCLKHADTLLNKRDHKFIHRRAVIEFELAKIYYEKERLELDKTFNHLNDAEDFFEIKLLLDPFSFYSYADYISLLIWKIESLQLKKEQELLLKLKIEDLFNTAFNAVSVGINRIQESFETYKNKFQFAGNREAYLKELEDLYEDKNLRPFALILLFNFYLDNDNYKLNEIIDELELYENDEDIAIFLFKYYGRRTNIANYRLRFFDLSRQLSNSKISDTIRYYYFNYIANAYNQHFSDAEKYLNKIASKYPSVNPEYMLLWRDTNSDTIRLFEGIIVKTERGNLRLKVNEFQKQFRISATTKDTLIANTRVIAELRFHLNGIFAEIKEIL